MKLTLSFFFNFVIVIVSSNDTDTIKKHHKNESAV